jgi:hypothetical protein
MSETKVQSKTAAADDKAQAIIIDLGKHGRKKVRNLRKGRGELLDVVQSKVRQLQADGTLPSGAPPVIVIVKQKKRRTSFF